MADARGFSCVNINCVRCACTCIIIIIILYVQCIIMFYTYTCSKYVHVLHVHVVQHNVMMSVNKLNAMNTSTC